MTMTEYRCKLCQQVVADTSKSREDIMQEIRLHFEKNHPHLNSGEFKSHLNEQ